MMRGTPPVTSTRDIDYLQRVLSMDPRDQSQDIVAARLAWQNNDSQPEALAPVSSREDRYRDLTERVDSLRSRYWSLDEHTLQDELNQLNLDEFPDLKLAGTILQSVSSRVAAFQRLKAHPHCFPEFLDSFRNLVIAAPRQAIALRHALESDAQHGLSYPRSRSPREYRRLATTIQNEFPELAALQPSVLKQIASNGLTKRLTQALFAGFLPSVFGELLSWIGRIVLSIILIALARWMLGSLR